MRLSARRYAEAYLAAVEGASEPEVSAIARRFVSLLRRRRQHKLWPKILAAVIERWNEKHGVVAIRLTTARRVEEQSLAERFGRTVELTTRTDRKLIGGAIVERGDQRVDGSLRGRLDRLRASLQERTLAP